MLNKRIGVNILVFLINSSRSYKRLSSSLKMVKFLNSKFWAIFLYTVCVLTLFFGCANKQPLTGGPKDEVPPKVIKEIPENITRNFSAPKVDIYFDKFITLRNEFAEISISPDMDKMPKFKAYKKQLTIKFEEELEKNTTYTINFGKGIVDENEGNVLKNYSYVFSTGNELDSLSISGNVKSSITNKSLEDVTVFILPLGQDSLLGKKKPKIFTNTDTAGNFALKNLKENSYRIYAVKQPSGGDRIFKQETDEIGFYNDSIALNKNITGINLRLFKEIPTRLRLLSEKMEADGRISLIFNKAVAELKITEPTDLDQKKILEYSTKKDSAFIWLPEITFDSLKIKIKDRDTSQVVTTINRNQKDTYVRSVVISNNLINEKLNPYSDLLLSFSSPMAEYNISKITLLEDSIPVTGFQIAKDSLSTRKFKFEFPWKPQKMYVITLGDSSFTDIYNTKSKKYSKKLMLDPEENYANLTLAVTVPDTTKSYLIKLFNDKKNKLRTDIISKNTLIKYSNYLIGKYTIQVVYDTNKNGEWDTGNVLKRQQPEKIWVYEKDITLRTNWDLEEKMSIPADQ